MYILDKSSLSDVSFADIFPQSVACLFTVLTLRFTEQKFLILMSPAYQLLFSRIVPLILYLKIHYIQGHLCYHVGVL